MSEFKFGILREKEARPNKLESNLSEYLHYIFPDEEILFDIEIEKPTWANRVANYLMSHDTNLDLSYRKYRPDARIESLGLIVEFDGNHHYNKVSTLFDDEMRNTILGCLGYKIIRIPFFVQLTKEMILHFFGIEVEKGCQVPSGFFSLTRKPDQLNPNCPANFCMHGLRRFVNEVQHLPFETQREISYSLRYQAEFNGQRFVLPPLDGNDPTCYAIRNFVYAECYTRGENPLMKYRSMDNLCQLYYNKFCLIT